MSICWWVLLSVLCTEPGFTKRANTSYLAMQVRELDLSQVKATELLKANEGDVKKAIQAFIAVA